MLDHRLPSLHSVICRVGLSLLTLVLLASACSFTPSLGTASPAPTAHETGTATPVPSVSPSVEPSPTPTPFQPATATPTLKPSPTATPEPLPTILPAGFLRSGVTPTTYLADTCQYLRLRWDPKNSAPGTIVVPIMYHSIVKDGRSIPAGDNTSVTAAYFKETMEHAHDLGYQTVTAAQVADFLENNAPIPERSLMLIVDDRRQGLVQEHFMPYLEEWNWTVTMAYITGVAEPQEWKSLEALAATGHVDVQAHGFLHNGDTYIKPWTPNDTILSEINAPIPLFKEHFGYAPTAFIWPGGDYNLFAVQAARQAGYRIGFTVHSRGPLMFNWIPLGEPELEMNDPLLVLPRYWSTAAWVNLDEAVALSEAMKAEAEKSKPIEMSWMEKYCQ